MAAPLRPVLALGAMIALTCVGLEVRAQSASDAAREAFAAGLAAERAGRSDEACASFRKSLALVRELGPLQKAAACDEREGKVRSAAALLDELLTRLPAEDSERGAVQERLRIARSRLGRLTIQIRAGAPSGIKARVDGAAVTVPATDLEVDPGRRELVVEVPGKGVELHDVEVTAGGRASITIPDDDAPKGAKPPETAPAPTPAEESRALPTAGWILGGVGVAGFIGVAATGIPLLGKSSDFDKCKTAGCQRDVSDDASPLVAINTVMWGVGIAGIGLGATFLLIDAGSSGPKVDATIGPGQAAVRGSF